MQNIAQSSCIRDICLTCLKKLMITHFIRLLCPNREEKCGNNPMRRERLGNVVRKSRRRQDLRGISQTTLTGEVPPRGCTRAVYQNKLM